MPVDDRLLRRGVPQNELLKLEQYNTWRVVLYDLEHGIVVIDIEADNEADAKGKARSAAQNHLTCKHIDGATAMRWTDLPDAWKRMNARRI